MALHTNRRLFALAVLASTPLAACGNHSGELRLPTVKLEKVEEGGSARLVIPASAMNACNKYLNTSSELAVFPATLPDGTPALLACGALGTLAEDTGYVQAVATEIGRTIQKNIDITTMPAGKIHSMQMVAALSGTDEHRTNLSITGINLDDGLSVVVSSFSVDDEEYCQGFTMFGGGQPTTSSVPCRTALKGQTLQQQARHVGSYLGF